MNLPPDLEEVEASGFDVVENVLSPDECATFREEAARLASNEPDHAHGIRDLLGKSPPIRSLATSPRTLSMVPKGYIPVRGILFDKTSTANWKVAWHQDLTIAVARRAEVPDYGPWSVKHGVHHVQPPSSLLASMLTIRFHLDDTPASNGALRVISESHLEGRLAAARITELSRHDPLTCEVHTGGAMRMKPLILHASSPSEHSTHRRVIHLEYADPASLHPALQWHEAA